jgi:hypothetical protein
MPNFNNDCAVAAVNINCDLAAIRRRFRPSEMQVLAASAMDHEIDAASFADHVRDDLASGGVYAMMAQRYDVNAVRLVSKVRSTSAELTAVLLARLGDWKRLPYDESMGGNALPSICSLQRLGLAETEGPPAWGWFCLRNGLKVFEFVLRHPARMPLAESRTMDDVAAELVRLAEASPSPLADKSVWDCVYRLVKVTGWRRCRLTVDECGVQVSEIPIADFLSDLYDGTLQGVALAGVNAPDEY